MTFVPFALGLVDVCFFYFVDVVPSLVHSADLHCSFSERKNRERK